MKQLFIPLFWKFTIVLVLIVALFGSLNIWMIYHEVHESFRREMDNHGFLIGNTFAERVVKFMLYDDYSEIYQLTQGIKDIEPSVEYVILLNEDGQIVSHTFQAGVPAGLLAIHHGIPVSEESKMDVKVAHTSEIIRDYRIPVLEGKVGTLRIGLNEKNFRITIKTVLLKFLLMILAFLVVGIAGAFAFSYLITSPIKRISTQARLINLESLEENEEAQKIVELPNHWLARFSYLKDELDILNTHFEEMIQRLRKAHQELKSSQSSLIHSEKMSVVGTLVAGVCHNLNNPISGLRNCIRRISNDPGNQEQTQKYLPVMEEAVDNAAGILQELLAFSRKEDMVYENFSLQEVIENVIAVLPHELEVTRIAFTKKIAGRLPQVYGSKSQIEQVVLNIVKNGIDAIQEKQASRADFQGEIAFRIKEDKNHLKLDISDNGPGIAPDKLKLIFDPFFTTKKKGKGTGLGLSFSANIIHQHEGVIYAAKNESDGLTFTILLPLNVLHKSIEL